MCCAGAAAVKSQKLEELYKWEDCVRQVRRRPLRIRALASPKPDLHVD